MLKRIPILLQAPQLLKALVRTKPATVDSGGVERPRADWALASATSIAFSLAFFVGGLMLLVGVAPVSLDMLSPALDLGVLVLMVPLCALTLAIVVEVLRAAMSGPPRIEPPRLAAALSDWRPGHGEG